MASNMEDWTEILKPSYNTYKCEEDAYIEISKITIDNEIAMEFVYENAVRDNAEVCSNLRMIYAEAINGTNKDVRRRVLSRMSNFKRLYGQVYCMVICLHDICKMKSYYLFDCSKFYCLRIIFTVLCKYSIN